MDCPKCGNPYLYVRKYTDGDCLYVHAAKLVLGGKMAEVTKSCCVKANVTINVSRTSETNQA